MTDCRASWEPSLELERSRIDKLETAVEALQEQNATLAGIVAAHEEELAARRPARAVEASRAVLGGAVEEADRDTTPGIHVYESER